MRERDERERDQTIGPSPLPLDHKSQMYAKTIERKEKQRTNRDDGQWTGGGGVCAAPSARATQCSPAR